MADFTQIIQKINDDINTNGVGAITGAKLNEVLRDIVAAVNAEKQDTMTIDATPTEDSTNPVQSGGVFTALQNLIAENALFGGIVGPESQPWQGADHRYFYLAIDPGTYVNFNNLEVYGPSLIRWNWGFWGIVTLWPSEEALTASFELKADKVSEATDGDLAGLDADGNLTDSGIAASDVVTSSDLATVATSGSYNDLLNKPTIPAAQVNSDWNANSGVAQILNKPTIPAAQIQSDWNEADNTKVDYIKNKPTIPAAQVQSDWNEADNTKVDYIKNKPTIPNVSGKADKVGGATNGDFAGLDANGNLTDSGKKASDFATPIPVVDASTIPASMEPNKLYKYGTLSGDTVFPSLATPTDQSRANVYWWKFTTPASTINVQMPSSITIWNGGQAPTIDPSTTYEITVEDGFGTCIKS